MITATGNNFGAGAITLAEYTSPELLILNGKFSFAPSNIEYIAATELEIYFPNLQVEQSASAYIYIATTSIKADITQYSCVPVIAKIKNQNTLSIEKLTEWDAQANVEIYIHTAFIPDRIRDNITAINSYEMVIASSDYEYQVANSKYYDAENWIYLNLEFTKFTHATPGQDGFIILDTLLQFKRTEIPLISLSSPGEIMGNEIALCQIYDNEIHCEGLNTTMIGNNTPALIRGFFLKQTTP